MGSCKPQEADYVQSLGAIGPQEHEISSLSGEWSLFISLTYTQASGATLGITKHVDGCLPALFMAYNL